MAGGLDFDAAQEAIFGYIEQSVPYTVLESDVPTEYTQIENNGLKEPLVIVQFTDAYPRSGGKNFGGPVYDEYYGIVRIDCLAPTAKQVRTMMSLINQILLGKSFYNTGSLSKTFGGGNYILGEANTRPSAYGSPISFQYAVNMADVGATNLPA